MEKKLPSNLSLESALKWSILSGADEAISEKPLNYFEYSLKPTSLATTSQTANKPLAASTAKSSSFYRQTPCSANQNISCIIKTPIIDNQHLASISSLEELRKNIENFTACPLKATAIHTVFGDGNPNADIMVIGEAPGSDEDRIGLPFVGKSGILLDKMLLSVGLSRQDNIYISNILPWRPPGNRTPSSDEVALCLPFIKKHIELICPKILLLLGASASSALLGTTEGITRIRGKCFTYNIVKNGENISIPTLVTFHPAFLLRSPLQKRKSWQDMLELKRMLQEIRTNKD